MFYARYLDDKDTEVVVSEEKTVDGILYWNIFGGWIPASFLEFAGDMCDGYEDDWGSDNGIMDYDYEAYAAQDEWNDDW